MKKYTLYILFFLSKLCLAQQGEQSFYYHYHDSAINLTLDKKDVYIKFTDNSTPYQRLSAVTQVFNIDTFSSNKILRSPFNSLVIVLTDSLDEGTLFEDFAILKSNPNIMYVNPVTSGRGFKEAITDKFIVKLKNMTKTRELDSMLYVNKDSIIQQERWNDSIFVIALTKSSLLNSMQQANLFYNTGLFAFTEPDFFVMNAFQSVVNDPYFPNQWGLQNTGQSMADQSQQNAAPGVDINLAGAWQITTGDPNIKIAIIDEGTDLTHPDIINNLLPGFDATYGPYQSQNGTNTKGAPLTPYSDFHGTATAGIAAATGNNGIGMAGVAYNCKIIPVRAGTAGGFYPSDCANAITWAASPTKGNADVLNCSWGGPPSSLIESAINNAITIGRNGLGCVVVCSAGNGNPNNYDLAESSVISPASYQPYVLSVGACDEFGGLAGFFNDNNSGIGGFFNWPANLYVPYSNFGSGLDIVAPAGSGNASNTIPVNTIQVIEGNIYTTVPSGSVLDNLGGGYTSYFSGTSAAAPLVSGVAALILSVNKCLSYQSVINIIEFTATKQTGSSNQTPYYSNFPSAYCYAPDYPNGTWNEYLGYGIVNAANAVSAAFSVEPFIVNTVNESVVAGPYPYLTMIFEGLSGVNGCQPSNLSNGFYLFYPYRVSANIKFNYNEYPALAPSSYSNGWSESNPNNGQPYIGFQAYGATSGVVWTYVYHVYDLFGDDLGYFPADPSYVKFTYSIISSIYPSDLYFQDQTVANSFNAGTNEDIYAGDDVEPNLTLGNYVIQSGAHVGFHAANTIYLEPGFVAQAGSEFTAAIGPAFYPCSQYPNPKKPINDTNNYHKYFPKNIDTSLSLPFNNTAINYPNPFNEYTYLQLNVTTGESVIIKITDLLGRDLIVIKTNLEKGINTLKINGSPFAAGIYLYHIVTPGGIICGRIVKID